MTKHKNGCFNHAPYGETVVVQDGYQPPIFNVRDKSIYKEARYVEIKDDMTKDCQYTRSAKTNGDPGCIGCKWKTETPDLA